MAPALGLRHNISRTRFGVAVNDVTLKKVTIRLPMGASFQRTFDASVERLRGAVIPIIGEHNGSPILLASAVLLLLQNRHFMVTAQHVLDENKTTTLYFFGGTGEPIPLLADFFIERKLDIAICDLSPDQVNSLSHKLFLTNRNFRTKAQARQRTYAAVVGYPATKTKVLPGTTFVDSEMFSMANFVRSEGRGQIFVTFEKKRVTYVDVRRQLTAPDPYGMSGGAIFSMPVTGLAMLQKTPAVLAGIATHWRRSRRLFEGVTIDVVQKILKEEFSITHVA
jgi:hypothetical protein